MEVIWAPRNVGAHKYWQQQYSLYHFQHAIKDLWIPSKMDLGVKKFVLNQIKLIVDILESNTSAKTEKKNHSFSIQ